MGDYELLRYEHDSLKPCGEFNMDPMQPVRCTELAELLVARKFHITEITPGDHCRADWISDRLAENLYKLMADMQKFPSDLQKIVEVWVEQPEKFRKAEYAIKSLTDAGFPLDAETKIRAQLLSLFRDMRRIRGVFDRFLDECDQIRFSEESILFSDREQRAFCWDRKERFLFVSEQPQDLVAIPTDWGNPDLCGQTTKGTLYYLNGLTVTGEFPGIGPFKFNTCISSSQPLVEYVKRVYKDHLGSNLASVSGDIYPAGGISNF
jgi:hypothetical protein